MAVTGLALTVTAATLLITGCAHPAPAAFTAPSASAVAVALSSTGLEICTTKEAIKRAEQSASHISSIIPAAQRASFVELTNALALAGEHAAAAQSNAAATQTNLVTYALAVTNQTATLNTTTARLDYLEPKYEKSVGLVWKWRLIALGVIGAIGAFIVLKYGSRLAATAATLSAKIP